ncbi:DUF1837 domain-containing protein [Campylobacter canadensis]|nr:DUF1837 domain-containing protein [Campylobacter canadensis]MBZ8000258.1 DUF1837 domain-containing protein [Campylobacter canadensis]
MQLTAANDIGTIDFFMLPIINKDFHYNCLINNLMKILHLHSLTGEELDKYNSPIIISQKARERYVSFRKNSNNKNKQNDLKDGELGELILFALLEGHLKAPKILTKMSLKTSGGTYVHGSDGVHLYKKGDRYQLIFDESKLYQNIRSAIKNAFDSIHQFKNEIDSYGNHKAGINYEKSLLSNNLEKHVFSEEKKEIIEQLIIPCEFQKNISIDDAFSIFIGYEINIEQEQTKYSDSEFELKIKEKIKKDIDNLEKLFNDHIKKLNLYMHSFYIYLIPFTKLEENRSKIINRILS